MSGLLWFIQLSETSPVWQDESLTRGNLRYLTSGLDIVCYKNWSYLGTCSGMLYFKYANPIMHGLKFQTQKWLDQITNLQSSYASNRCHQIKERGGDLISCISFVWFTNTETIVGNVCIYREMRHWIKIPELSEALFRKSVLDCKPRGDLCPCSLIGSYPWPLDCNFLWKGLNFGPTWNWWKDAFAIRIIWK